MPTQPRTDRVAVVVNTASRTGARALPLVESALRGASEQVVVHPASGGAELMDALRAAMAEEPDLLVVGGGDGTIGCAAGLVAHTRTTLGVLPLGTANDFARTLEIPTSLAAAAETLLAGKVVDVDLGRVDGRAYLNVASLGLSVAVTRRLTPGLKRRLGRFAYPVATLAAYRDHRPFAARIELEDGATLELEDLMQVAIGNGRLVTDEPLRVNLDGEVAATTPATFEVDRNALHIVVPAHSRAARMDDVRSP